MSLFGSDKRAWIIFDTSQYPKYYRDVHDILASPEGQIARYEYREGQLSDDAIAMAKSQKKRRPLLLVYAQRNTPYRRTDTFADIPDETVPIRFVATRFGEMLNVVADGERYYFDFELGRYPNQEDEALKALLKPLIGAREVPWDKWVSACEDAAKFEDLKGGNDAGNWERTIEQLGSPPMQFAQDAFWRVLGPYDQSGKRVRPSVERLRHEGVVRQARSYFLLPDTQTWRLEVVSATPKGSDSTRPEYEIVATSSDTKVLTIIGGGRYELRHYATNQLEYHTEARLPFFPRSADLVLDTRPSSSWPAGARIEFRHRVRKRPATTIEGIAIGILGVVLLGIGGSKFAEQDPPTGALFVVLGGLFSIWSYFRLSGKLEFKT